MTYYCTRHQRNEPLSNAPLESQLRGVLWVDRCEVAEDLPSLETPNEPGEALRPVYEALRRIGKELAELRRGRYIASDTQERRRDIRVDLGDGPDIDPGGPAP